MHFFHNLFAYIKKMLYFCGVINQKDNTQTKTRTQTMARPIAETPILFGKDAERFLYNMQHVEPLPRERQEKIKEAYEWMKSIATFPM